MNLVYNEYIRFLNDKGLKEQTNIELKEGYYWYDNSIIKAYDTEGNIHKIVKLKIDDDLNITFIKYNNKQFNIESWQQTVERSREKLIELENESLNLINYAIRKFNGYNVAVTYSGGKDSEVTKYLVNKCTKDYRILFNNTTCDVKETYRFIKQIPNIEIITPKEGIYQWIKRNNFIQTRLSRSCCDIFKEKAMIDYLNKEDNMLLFLGMRNQESTKRKAYDDFWNNNKWSDNWQGVLPIRKWTEEDIWLYILLNNIPFNPKYRLGYRRCGCNTICPFYSKSTWVLDKYWYNSLYTRWHNMLEQDFINNKKACVLNCTLKEYHINWNGGVVHPEPSEECIKEFSEQQNLDYEIAKKYFNKTCSCCNKKLKKDDIALSMKYYGRHIESFKCIKCISKELGTTTKELKERAKQFKEDGCVLF